MCPILEHRIIGPHFLEGNINAMKYLDFVQKNFTPIFKNLLFAWRRNIIFQQDGFSVGIKSHMLIHFQAFIGVGRTYAPPTVGT